MNDQLHAHPPGVDCDDPALHQALETAGAANLRYATDPVFHNAVDVATACLDLMQDAATRAGGDQEQMHHGAPHGCAIMAVWLFENAKAADSVPYDPQIHGGVLAQAIVKARKNLVNVSKTGARAQARHQVGGSFADEVNYAAASAYAAEEATGHTFNSNERAAAFLGAMLALQARDDVEG